MSQTIYIADDEKNIRDLEAVFLEREGFAVETFENGGAVLAACERKMPNLVALDVMMPDIDGLSVCSALRSQNPNLPIIIVSAKDSPYDRVAGLTFGSDDYLVKPFLPLELVARVKALLRRAGTTSNTSTSEVVFSSLTISPAKHTATWDGKILKITPTEFEFLRYLAENSDRVVKREELLNALWQVSWQADTRAADDLVKRLRKKLREQNCNLRIETVWGIGFRLVAEEDPK